MTSQAERTPKLQLALIKTSTKKGAPFDIYHLHVKDASGQWPDRNILVADLSRMGGGISLEKWKLNWNEQRPIISVYLQTSIMGHDLDQWVHYDWETGEQLEAVNFDVTQDQVSASTVDKSDVVLPPSEIDNGESQRHIVRHGIFCSVCSTYTISLVAEESTGVSIYKCSTCKEIHRFCPRCQQGWVEKYVDKMTEEQLYKCDECDAVWNSSETIGIKDKTQFWREFDGSMESFEIVKEY